MGGGGGLEGVGCHVMHSCFSEMAGLDKHSYLFKDVLRNDPQSALKFCTELQEQWHETFSKDTELTASMDKWRESSTVKLVQFRHGATGNDTASKHCDAENDPTKHCDAENDRTSERQSQQHLQAFSLVKDAVDTQGELSEKLIKDVHRVLMKDLHSDGKSLHAGEYRQIPMHCWTPGSSQHNYVNHKLIPGKMEVLVKKYNDSSKKKHDQFELASWLLMELLQIHPFEEGNGRVSRMIWCYSLLRDGLLFPVIPFPGIKKGYRQYIRCIWKDYNECSYNSMTALTLVSVTMTWKNFISKLDQNQSKVIIAWLKQSDNLLEGIVYI